LGHTSLPVDENPVLYVTVDDIPGNSIRICASGSSGRLEAVIGNHIQPGSNIRDIFIHAPYFADEWIEFLLKVRYYGNDSSYDYTGGSAFHTSLLFTGGGWYIARLEYNATTGSSSAVFSVPGPVGAGRLINSQQKLWLDKLMQQNYNWDADLEKKYIYLPKSITTLLGIADDASVIPCDRFLGHVHPADRRALIKEVKQTPLAKSELHVRLVSKNLDVYHFSSCHIAGYDKNGKVRKIVGQAVNVTGDAARKEKISMSEQRFRGIVESSQDIFVVVGKDERITYVSPNISGILGYAQREVAGEKFSRFLADPSERDSLLKEHYNVVAGGRFSGGDFQVLRADGAIAWFVIRMSGIKDASGNVAEIVAVCHDMTEDKKTREHFQYVSRHDPLTGVYNRPHFERELYRIDHEDIKNVGLLLTDLNGLKNINDTYGHERGDDHLIETSNMLSSVCGENMDVYRIGGDEFAILSFGTTAAELDALTDRINRLCEDTAGNDIPLSLSFGSNFRSDSRQTMRRLYMDAESDMYFNKLLKTRSTRSHLIASLKEALRVRNLETSDHTRRMEKMVKVIGKDLGLSASELDRLTLLASMHDIGKVAIPDAIINKPGPLTLEEWTVMRTHSEIGFHLATTSHELAIIAHEIMSHHERWDGGGYPKKGKKKTSPCWRA